MLSNLSMSCLLRVFEIIVWRGSLEVNPSILTHSYFVFILLYEPGLYFVLWTISMEIIISSVFLVAKPANSEYKFGPGAI